MAELSPHSPYLLLLNGPQVGIRVPLDFPRIAENPFVLGRSAEVSLLLNDPSNRVSRKHASLEYRKEDQLLLLRDLSTNGTYLNGQLIASLTPLYPGDVIGCGSLQLLFVVPIEGIKTLLAQLPDEKHLPEDAWPGVARLDTLVSDARNLKVGSFCRLNPEHPFTIGRFSDNDLQLLDEDVSRSHAEIRWIGGRYVLRDLGAANPTYINGDAVDAPRPLEDFDLINIRGSEFRYRAPRVQFQTRQKAESASKGEQHLRFALDSRRLALGPKAISLPHDRQVFIGRTESNDLRLLDPYVSKRHASLLFESGHFILTDLGTSNGIQVNGLDIKRPIALKEKDRVKIGHFEFIFEEAGILPEGETPAVLRSGTPISLELKEISDSATADSGMYETSMVPVSQKDIHPLRKFAPFDELDTALFELLKPYFKEVTYPSGIEIAKEGQGRGAFFAVLEGYITISRSLDDRSEQRLVLAEIGPGSIYGERTVFADQPFVNRLVARTKVTTLRMEEADFVKGLSSNQQILTFFRQQVASFSTATWLRGTSLMSTLSDKTIRELAGRMRYRPFKAGEIMAERDKACEEFFLIVGGKAEAFVINKKGEEAVIAELEEGDTFGDGIAEENETYTETVRAVRPVESYVLTKADFEAVLSQSTDPIANLGVESRGLPLDAVLKRINPFNTMPPQLVAQIARRMKIKKFSKGRAIYRQGEKADAFYIIRKGQVEVSFQTSSGENRTDMTLGYGQFFGEAAISNNPKHVNTITTIEDCQLLTLYRPQFEEVLRMGGGYSLGQYLAKGISKRYRPKRISNWSITEQVTAQGETQYLLSKGEDYFKLSEGGKFLWNLMDGDNSINDLALGYFMEFRSLDLEGVSNLVAQLQTSGFLEIPSMDERLLGQEGVRERGFLGKIGQKLYRALTFSTEIKNVDGFFTNLYKYGGRLFFMKPVFAVLSLIVLAGIFAFVVEGGLVGIINPPLAQLISDSWWILILVLLFNFFIHELAHGIATKRYNRKVGGVGIGWNVVGPVFHVDTNQIWLERRKPRIIVNLAGPLTNILFCNICFLLLLFDTSGGDITKKLLFQMGLLAFTIAYINLNPLVEGDGYYALMDWVEIPGLRKKALVHVRRWLTRKPDVRPYTNREKRIFRWFVAFLPLYLTIIMVQFIFWFGAISATILQGAFGMKSDTAVPLGWVVAIIITLIVALPLFIDLFAASKTTGDEDDETMRAPAVKSNRNRGGSR